MMSDTATLVNGTSTVRLTLSAVVVTRAVPTTLELCSWATARPSAFAGTVITSAAATPGASSSPAVVRNSTVRCAVVPRAFRRTEIVDSLKPSAGMATGAAETVNVSSATGAVKLTVTVRTTLRTWMSTRTDPTIASLRSWTTACPAASAVTFTCEAC